MVRSDIVVCFASTRQPFAALQASPLGVPHQTLDEGLFHVLYGVSLSLSSVSHLLHSPWGTMHEGGTQRVEVQLQVGSILPKSLIATLSKESPRSVWQV